MKPTKPKLSLDEREVDIAEKFLSNTKPKLSVEEKDSGSGGGGCLGTHDLPKGEVLYPNSEQEAQDKPSKPLIIKTTPSKQNIMEFVNSDARVLISKDPKGKCYHHDSKLGKTELEECWDRQPSKAVYTEEDKEKWIADAYAKGRTKCLDQHYSKELKALMDSKVKEVEEEVDWERCRCGAGRRLKNSVLAILKK